jgi:hypothetical protein
VSSPRKAPVVMFDLETIDSEVPAVGKPGQEDRCPAAPHHRILCAGALALDPETLCVRRRDDGTPGLSLLGGVGARELDVLLALRKTDQAGVHWLSYNGRGFDWAVIIARAMHYRLVWPGLFHQRLMHRYQADAHTDLQDELTWHGASAWPSASAMAQLVGFPGKGAVDGSKVNELALAGRRDDVEIYCLEDVVQQTAVAMAKGLVAGFFGPLSDEAKAMEKYRAAAQSLIDLVTQDARLERLKQQVNTGLFLAAA